MQLMSIAARLLLLHGLFTALMVLLYPPAYNYIDGEFYPSTYKHTKVYKVYSPVHSNV